MFKIFKSDVTPTALGKGNVASDVPSTSARLAHVPSKFIVIVRGECWGMSWPKIQKYPGDKDREFLHLQVQRFKFRFNLGDCFIHR